MKFSFRSRVLLGFVAVLLLTLGSFWIAIDITARHAGDTVDEHGTVNPAAASVQGQMVVPMASLRRDIWISGGLVVIVGLIASLLSARWLAKPVDALDHMTRGLDRATEQDGAPAPTGDLSHVANALHGLTHSAHHDALTGLPNRTFFNILLKDGLERARRTKGSLALAFIDLDGFKKINDTLGHKMGDLVLRKTAERMSRSVKAPSSVSRLGGDEFVLILEGATQAQALMTVEGLIAAVRVPIRSPSGPIQVGMSTGIAIYPQVAIEREQLLKLADAAMYRSKAKKCGPVVARLGDLVAAPAPAAARAELEIGADGNGDTWSGLWQAPTATGAFRVKSMQSESTGGRAAPIPHNELERLTALRRLEILDKLRSPSFDRITQLAAKSLGMPIALISIVDERRQWFMSRVGVEVSETPRSVSLCGHAVYNREPLVVPDATLDRRFHDNALVTGNPHVRAYAGIPIYSSGGFALGTLCVIDREPRDFSAEHLKILADLASMVEDLLQAREVRIASGRRLDKVASS